MIPPTRTLGFIVLLLLAVSFNNLLRWRAESREFEALRQRYEIRYPRGGLPMMTLMDMDNARLGITVQVLETQNRLLRDQVRDRFGTQRLAEVERASSRSDELGPQASPRAW